MAKYPPKKRFAEVLDYELDEILSARGENPDPKSDKSDAEIYANARDANLRGLAFSGGGIRSATFNLGVIQAIAKAERLHQFDYLSTVSGGGYIGSWLSALLHRNKQDKQDKVDADFVESFQSRLTTHPCANRQTECSEQSGFKDPNASGFPPVEHAAVRYLRGYSNYLTPRLGLSGDVLALVSLFLRNVMLVQIVLALIIAIVLLIPYIINAMSQFVISSPQKLPMEIATVSLLGVVFLFIALIFCGVLLNRGKRRAEINHVQDKEHETAESAQRDASIKKKAHAASEVVVLIIFPAFVGAWLITTGLASSEGIGEHIGSRWIWIAYGALFFTLLWAIAFVLSRVRIIRTPENDEAKQTPILQVKVGTEFQPLISRSTAQIVGWLLGAAVISGAVLGLLLFEGATFANTYVGANADRVQEIVTFAPPLFLLALSFVETIHIGGSRNCFDEHDREWWARLGGFVLLGAAAWTALFGLVLYAPPVIYWLGNGGFVVAIAWLGGSAAGASAAERGSAVTNRMSTLGTKWLIRIGPWLFIIGLAALVSFLVFLSLLAFADMEVMWLYTDRTLADAIHWTTEQESQLKLRHPLLLASLVLAATLVAIRVFDINIFSAHSLYKNRLTRAYLGASLTGKRRAHPFTGFDPKDDIRLSDLKGQRPIQILNTTINMTGGDDLAWQTRRAASFSITPYYAGLETKSTQGVELRGYRPTCDFAGGMTLGTALAISGAAASPNMGYHTSPSVAALLTAFNLRLGYWAGNPKNENTWSLASPKYAFRPLVSELTGSARERSPWINLTDGGHFDNLGIYELIRRRCRLIVVTDAGCDPNHHFEDLANTIRKCWTDFGVDIVMHGLQELRLLGSDSKGSDSKGSDSKGSDSKGSDIKYAQAQSVCGEIRYPNSNTAGRIIYIKSSLTRAIHDNIPDIGQYADSHETFPHETTVDQFFDENQFEAYRHLGYKAATDALIRFEKEFAMDHLVFTKKLVSELIGRTPQLSFDIENAYDQYVILLYASLIEIAHSINTLVEQDATVATKTITRGMLEAWVDFINLVDDPEYIDYLSLRNLDEWLRTYREAQNGNEVFAQILESPNFQQRLEQESAEAKRLKADGVRLLNVRQRFEKADLLDIYAGVYAWLCSESHNSYRALVTRHIVASEESMSLHVLKETSIEDHLQVLDTLGEVLLKTAILVHEKYGENADEVADLEIEFKQVRESIKPNNS